LTRAATSPSFTPATDVQAIAAVRKLLADVGLDGGLTSHGVKPSQLDALADQALADPCHQTNPVPVTRNDLRRLYELAM
jgi:alcohol dehydrogenase class IV